MIQLNFKNKINKWNIKVIKIKFKKKILSYKIFKISNKKTIKTKFIYNNRY